MTIPKKVSPAFYLFVIIFLGLFLRVWIAVNYYGTFDVNSWEKIFDHWRTGQSPYDAARRYSYSPIWFWVLSGVSRLNVFLKLPVHFAVKLPLILADVLTLFLLLKLATALHQNARQRLGTAALFFLNPVSFLNTAYHGQFDNISYALVLLACYFNYGSFKLMI